VVDGLREFDANPAPDTVRSPWQANVFRPRDEQKMNTLPGQMKCLLDTPFEGLL
jgi:hypothetical protein